VVARLEPKRTLRNTTLTNRYYTFEIADQTNYVELAAGWREAKKSFSNLPSPRTLRSSVNPKKGIRSTARSAISERIPLNFEGTTPKRGDALVESHSIGS
jgi:hypothetical protein